MKVLVTGAVGQLGTDVMTCLTREGFEAVGTCRADCDLTDPAQVHALFQRVMPDAVIHCAAYTSVDPAESNAGICEKINVDGTYYVAREAAACSAKLVYISTDYVFDGSGDKPHETDESKNPLNVYGKTKSLGEDRVTETCSKYFIVRTSWVFGEHGKNFVYTMLKLGDSRTEINVVNDQIGSPTYTPDLAHLLCEMIKTEKYGIYHATNEGFCSWAQFAQAIMDKSGKECIVNPVPSTQYHSEAARPLNSRLSKSRLTENGFEHLPPWQNALDRFLENIKD